MYKKFGMCAVFFLSACTTDPIPEEEFEGPTGHFPLLGNVPDRPDLPEPKTLIRQQKHLQKEHDQATQKQDAVIKSITP